MSQTPLGVKIALPSTPTIPGRSGMVQIVQPSAQFNQSSHYETFKLRPSNPITQMNTNTAVQYVRRASDITVLSSGATLTPINPVYGSPIMAFNPTSLLQLPPGQAGPTTGSMPVQPSSINNLSNLANSRKPCNCTKSHCLKLYCECFAQGQLCQNCNCNNCMNNLSYEEERGRAIKMTLERNPTAFHPKIGRGEGERKHTKGCNCKRSGCLKNYCECYEAKISCSDLCRCQGCRNTEESVERRSLMRLEAMGSLRLRQPLSLKKQLIRPPSETMPHVFFTWEVIEATVNCLLAQAEDAERRDMAPAVQERIILEEFGRSIERIIESASKAQIRPPTTTMSVLPTAGDSDSEHNLLPGLSSPTSRELDRLCVGSSGGRDLVGVEAAHAAAADVLRDDDMEDDDDHRVRRLTVSEDNVDDLMGIGDEDMVGMAGRLFANSSRQSRSSRRPFLPTPSRSGRIQTSPRDEDEEDDDDDDEVKNFLMSSFGHRQRPSRPVRFDSGQRYSNSPRFSKSTAVLSSHDQEDPDSLI